MKTKKVWNKYAEREKVLKIGAESVAHTSIPWKTGKFNNEKVILGPAHCGLGLNEVLAKMPEVSSFDKFSDETEANAEFIVRAVNAHDQMLEALNAVLKTMYAHPAENVDMITSCSTTVKMAIAKAEGK